MDGGTDAAHSFAATTFPGPQPLPPSKHIAVVACMDARLDPRKALGIEIGEAHVIANGECGERAAQPRARRGGRQAMNESARRRAAR